MMYDVYFKQVNSERYRVEADNEKEAIEKAGMLWINDFGLPEFKSIESERIQKKGLK